MANTLSTILLSPKLFIRNEGGLMKKILILGSGAGGTMMAAKLRKELNELE